MLRHLSPARWLTVCIACLLATFLADTIYSRRVSSKLDVSAASIAGNGAVGVVHLSHAYEDIWKISERILRSRPESAQIDGDAVGVWLEDMSAAIAAYRLTEDYPGEFELFQEADRLRSRFVEAVGEALATVASPPIQHEPALDSFISAAHLLSAAVGRLMVLNSDQVRGESKSITQIRHQATSVFTVSRSLTLIFAVLGLVFGSAATRRYVASIERSERLAEERARELELFAGRVAHDLRAPLAVIEMKSALGERNANLPMLKSALDGVGRQGRRMADMMDTLLAFAWSGAAPEPGICTNVEEVVGDVIVENQALALQKRTEMIVEPMGPMSLACSPSVLSILLSNLVRNAIKYMGDAEPRQVTIRAASFERCTRFEVEDTGPGLPEGSARTVFEPFVRGARTCESGIGLGLATVKRFVESHGGRVGVESTPGRGSRFWFALPRTSSSARQGWLPVARSSRMISRVRSRPRMAESG